MCCPWFTPALSAHSLECVIHYSVFAVIPKHKNLVSQRQDVRSHFSGLTQDLIAFRGLSQTITAVFKVISSCRRESHTCIYHWIHLQWDQTPLFSVFYWIFPNEYIPISYLQFTWSNCYGDFSKRGDWKSSLNSKLKFTGARHWEPHSAGFCVSN